MQEPSRFQQTTASRVNIISRDPTDNHIKAVQDALTHAGIWRDDAQIDRLVVVRADPCPNAPMLTAVIALMDEINDSA